MTDQAIVIIALNQAYFIIADYLEPGRPRDAAATINRLIEVLDNQTLATAIKRLEDDYAARVLK
jgi:hypothetical protein